MLKIYRLNKKQNTFEVTLKFKGVGVHVSFVDGNTYNGTPAKCYTKDTFKQRAIEASQMFKNGEITLERCVEDKNDQRKVVSQKPIARKVAIQQPTPKPVVQQPAPTPNPTPEPPTFEESQGEGDGGQTIEFANLGEAILYVAQNFKAEAKTDKEVRDILKSNGINPKIKRG